MTEVGQGGAADSSQKSQGNRDLGDRSMGLAQDELPPPAAFLGAGLMGTLRV